jgi:hypothetical protein
VPRFQLQHTVQRTGRTPTTDVTDHLVIDDAYRVADIEAAFTTVNGWRQELVDAQTGERWVRTPELTWMPLG